MTRLRTVAVFSSSTFQTLSFLSLSFSALIPSHHLDALTSASSWSGWTRLMVLDTRSKPANLENQLKHPGICRVWFSEEADLLLLLFISNL